MKKIFLVILSVIALVGCTLEEQVLSNSKPETYYQTIEQCRTGVNGCYTPLRDLYKNGDYFEACEVAADLIYHNSDSYYDAMCNYTQSEPRFGKTIWNYAFVGVTRCNAMDAAIERSPLTDDEKAPLMAEVVILRAFYYYILTINFGDIPYYFEEVTDANNDRISQMPRKPAKELRTILMDELEYWLLEKQALPNIKTYDSANEYRIGKMVGLTIAGKLALWNKSYDRALKFFQPIYELYKSPQATIVNPLDPEADPTDDPSNALLGYPIKDVMFRYRYTPESILELPGYSKDYGLRVVQNLASRCTPSRSSNIVEGADEDMSEDSEDASKNEKFDDFYNGIRIPELGVNARTTSPYRPTYYLLHDLLPYNSTDKRRSVYDVPKVNDDITNIKGCTIEDGGGWLAWCHEGCKYLTENIETDSKMYFFTSVGSEKGVPFLGPKFWCPGMIYTQDSNNIKIFRFAHVLLDMAEAYWYTEQWQKAYDCLNASKKRAGIMTTGGYDGNEKQFIQELQMESGRELFGEFTRRHNLVRWGIWYDQVVKHAKYGNYDATIANGKLKDCDIAIYVKEGPCREYYPIPDQQIVLSNYNLDNKEYAKYGL